MERYKNLGGDSGVTAYEIGQGSITVQFKDGAVYLYNNQSAGGPAISRRCSASQRRGNALTASLVGSRSQGLCPKTAIEGR